MATGRKLTRVVIAPGLVRYSVRLTGDDCAQDSHEAKIQQFLFIQWLSGNMPLLDCGTEKFAKLHIFHNGTCWQADAQAEAEENTDAEGSGGK
jgi:hypothetical protein